MDLRNHARLPKIKSEINKNCSVEGCKGKGQIKPSGKVSYYRGYCTKHYARSYNKRNILDSLFDYRGSITIGNSVLIPIGRNAKDGYSIVDKKMEFLKYYKWHMSSNYPATNILIDGVRKKIRMHHFVIGKPNHKMVIDHINHYKFDNRLQNLREVSYSQNALNRI